MDSSTTEISIEGPDEEITFEVSSGNVFADLGLSDPEERLAKSNLVIAISRAMEAKGLNQVKASRLMAVDQPTLSKLLRGRTRNFSLDKLTSMLRALGRNVEIRVSEDFSVSDQQGHVTVFL
jgi:predicted XRE-type DNA-binding protein